MSIQTSEARPHLTFARLFSANFLQTSHATPTAPYRTTASFPAPSMTCHYRMCPMPGFSTQGWDVADTVSLTTEPDTRTLFNHPDARRSTEIGKTHYRYGLGYGPRGMDGQRSQAPARRKDRTGNAIPSNLGAAMSGEQERVHAPGSQSSGLHDLGRTVLVCVPSNPGTGTRPGRIASTRGVFPLYYLQT